jgi:hypothetical protein
MCELVNLLFKFYTYVLSPRFKEFRYLGNDISSFFYNLIKLEIFCLFVSKGIVVKMDNFNLFEKVLNFLFHA